MIDHLVLATSDLTATAALFAELAGVVPIAGGQHLGRGTANYLVGLTGGAYLEIAGPDPAQPAPGRPRPFGIDELTRPRLVTWAVRTGDMAQALRAARARGHDPGPATAMSRRTDAGEVLAWQLTYDPAAVGDGVVPFLIDWGTSPHPTSGALPAVPLRSLTVVTPQTDAVRAACRALDVEVAVRPGLRPGLIAVLAGRRGEVVLT